MDHGMYRALGSMEGAARTALRCLEAGNTEQARRALREGLAEAEREAGPAANPAPCFARAIDIIDHAPERG